MHMGIFYYVVCLGALIVFTVVYTNKFWTKEKFEQMTDKSE